MESISIGSLSEIQLQVDIRTCGLAATKIIAVDVISDQKEITIAKSQNATGDVGPISIERSLVLNRRISILTVIDLIGNMKANKIEAENLSAEYIITTSTNISLPAPMKEISKDFNRVVLNQEIDIIP